MRLRKHHLSAYISCSLSTKSKCCCAFSGASRALFQHGKTGSLPSIGVDKQFLRAGTTSLFGEDDKGEGGNEKRPMNNLDIFGQPKDDDGRPKRNAFDDEGDIRGPDRIKSCIPYVLPLIDGDSFGKYIYERVPPLGMLDYVLLRPITEVFQAVPFLTVLLFLAFALGPRLTNQSREVRFNAQQAILIDVALILPQLVGEAVAEADAKLPRGVMEPCSNFVWYAYVSLVVYCVVSNLRGRKPDQIPFISGIADFAIGPF